ncbi:MAG: tripartite tricarboxylate transporter substrate binding protein [Marinomonas sp.]
MKLAHFMKYATLAASLAFSTVSMASDWKPSGQIMFDIGVGAGGETDAIGRTFAKVLEEQTGWKVVTQNKPGGAGIAMLSSMRNKRPDGKTIGLAVNLPVLVNLALRGKFLPFNLDSFDYLGTIASSGLDIVTLGDAPFNNIEELVAYSKTHDGVAIATDAKPQELIMKRIAEKTGANFKILVTKSTAAQLQLLLGGKAMVGLPSGKHIPYLKTGQLKLLASANSTRHSYAPDTPTLIEQGFNLFVDPSFFFAAPKGLSAEAKAALATAIDNAVNSPEVKTIVQNVLATQTNNLGPAGTRKMLDDGFEGVQVLLK